MPMISTLTLTMLSVKISARTNVKVGCHSYHTWLLSIELCSLSCDTYSNSMFVYFIGTFYTYNMDAVVFINEVMGKHLAGHIQQGGEVTVIMNLPALAIQFIGAFVGLLAEEPLDASSIKSTPTVHCYCFSKGMHHLYTSAQLLYCKQIDQVVRFLKIFLLHQLLYYSTSNSAFKFDFRM